MGNPMKIIAIVVAYRKGELKGELKRSEVNGT
jgi:hypothetical protein